MGLFINRKDHPDVFKNNEKINAPNQDYMKHDYISEYIDEQQRANVSLIHSFNEMKHRFYEQEDIQSNQWSELNSQLNDLKLNTQSQKEFEEQMIRWLKVLDEKNSQLQTANLELSLQISAQMELQKQLSEKFSNQEEFQVGVLNRLDQQEALTEKISRQLNHIRSILFERTNYLAQKMEDGYKLTSSYVYNLMTGSDQPLTFYKLNKKEEKKT
ncbi:hypothetical protein ACWM35_02975 [Neobacillus sp. K501]